MSDNDPVADVLAAINHKLDAIDSRLDGTDNRLDAIDNRLDGMGNRLDAMDSQLRRVNGELKMASHERTQIKAAIQDMGAGIHIRMDEVEHNLTEKIEVHIADPLVHSRP